MPDFFSGFRERLAGGESIVIAEGYLFEFERRGFVTAGSFVPEVVLEFPEQLKALHEEFVHAGSDVVEAYTVRYNYATLSLVVFFKFLQLNLRVKIRN